MTTRLLRVPAVAGSFYPDEAGLLSAEVQGHLRSAREQCLVRPKALVVPHAGYVYSGPIAASAYAQLSAEGPPVRKVVLFGPAHHVAFAGLAVPEASVFATPLGEVPVDQEAVERLRRLPFVGSSHRAHAQEHSLEVQLPFLQTVLKEGFELVPVVVGRASAEEVAQAMEAVWGGPETLVLVSTDLSHYLPYEAAQRVDATTAKQVLALAPESIEWEQACGLAPLRGLLTVAKAKRLSVQQLDLRNSGDTSGERGRVVGYAAFAFHEGEGSAARRRATSSAEGVEREAPGAQTRGERADESAGAAERGPVLLSLARRSIESYFEESAGEGVSRETFEALWRHEAWLLAQQPCFVSLHRDGELRGCVGRLRAQGPLRREVWYCARAAAFEDSRFSPLTRAELEGLDIEVSVLSPMQRLEVHSEEEALRALIPGRHGLQIAWGGRSAVFIPKMWDELPEPTQFLAHLRRKAGLPQYWLPGTRMETFTADYFAEARR